MSSDPWVETTAWGIALCVTCGRPFPQAARSFRVCQVCFKRERGYAVLLGDKALARMQDALAAEAMRGAGALARVAELERELAEAREEAKVARVAPGALSVVRGHIPDLLLLCHPDRHRNDERSNRITRWLLTLRSPK